MTLAFHDALRALAQAGGVLRMDDLADLLGFDVETPTWDRAFEDLLDEHERIVVLSGDRVGDLVALAAGTVLTHRLTEAEARHERVATLVDLAPLELLADRSLPLARGGRARMEIGLSVLGVPESHLAGPSGWLAGAQAGELVGFRLAGGRLHVERTPQPDDPEAAARALADGAARALAVAAELLEEPEELLADVFTEALAGAPGAMIRDADSRPGRGLAPAPEPRLHGVLPPLSELLDRAGLHHRGDVVFADDVDLPEPAPRGPGVPMAAALYGLDEDEAEHLQGLREALAALLDGEDLGGERAARCHEPLATPGAVFALLAELAAAPVSRGQRRAGGQLAEAVLATDPPAATRAGALVLAARVAELAGDHRAAEAHLQAALDADPEHPIALEDAAWFAEDRGDARRALALAQRGGAEDEVERLRSVLARRPADVGRNDPCPCGSGRKYKVCCARRDGGALPDRAAWLIEKVATFAVRDAQRHQLASLVEARGLKPAASDLSVYVDPLVFDVATFDAGLLTAFLEQRGHLLPADERTLAASWQDTARAVYRVERQRGDRLEVVELRPDGEGPRVTVRAPGAPLLERSALLLTRLVPSGGEVPLLWWAALPLGSMTMTPAFLEAVAAAGAYELLGALPVAAAWMRTTDGQPMIAGERRHRLPAGTDAEAAREALRSTELTEDPDSGAFSDLADIAGATRVRGSVRVTDDEVVVEASSTARLAHLAALVDSALPGLDLVVERRTPMWLAADDLDRFGIPLDREALESDPHAGLTALLVDQSWREASLDVADAQQRRAFTVPPASGELDGIDLEFLDPADLDDRALLIRAEHPELGDPDDLGDAPADVHDETADPRLHLAMHELVANQLWDDEPPEVWQTAKRLLGAGYDRHEVLHMLASVAAGETWRMLEHREVFDRERYVRGLAALPGSWEGQRPPPARGRRSMPPGSGHPA